MIFAPLSAGSAHLTLRVFFVLKNTFGGLGQAGFVARVTNSVESEAAPQSLSYMQQTLDWKELYIHMHTHTQNCALFV